MICNEMPICKVHLVDEYDDSWHQFGAQFPSIFGSDYNHAHHIVNYDLLAQNHLQLFIILFVIDQDSLIQAHLPFLNLSLPILHPHHILEYVPHIRTLPNDP